MYLPCDEMKKIKAFSNQVIILMFDDPSEGLLVVGSATVTKELDSKLFDFFVSFLKVETRQRVFFVPANKHHPIPSLLHTYASK